MGTRQQSSKPSLTWINVAITLATVFTFVFLLPILDLPFWTEGDRSYSDRLAGVLLVLLLPLIGGAIFYAFLVTSIAKTRLRGSLKRGLALLSSPVVAIGAIPFSFKLGGAFFLTFGVALPLLCGIGVRLR